MIGFDSKKEGRIKGCKIFTLDAFSFQAEKFYAKHGYQEIGVIPNYLFEHDRIFLEKRGDNNDRI